MNVRLYRVTGDSMYPNYCAGDYVLAFRRSKSSFGVGDVVVVRHPNFGHIIKRIVHTKHASMLRIAGDNLRVSTDSDTLGEVSPKRVMGKVLWHISAPKKIAIGQC